MAPGGAVWRVFVCGVWLVVTQARMLALGSAALTGFSGRGGCDVVYMGLALACLARVVAVREQRAARFAQLRHDADLVA